MKDDEREVGEMGKMRKGGCRVWEDCAEGGYESRVCVIRKIRE